MIQRCLFCKKEFKVRSAEVKRGGGKYCSRKCYCKSLRGRKDLGGKNNPAWKGGVVKKQTGYILIKKPEHPFCDKQGYMRRSRLIAEKCLGRYLTKKEVIHHIGIKYPMNSIENKSDDRPENLYLFIYQEHIRYHRIKNKIQLTSNLFL